MIRHIFSIAITALLLAAIYIVVVASTAKETAQDIGIGYIAVMVTVSFLWEVAHHNKRRGRNG